MIYFLSLCTKQSVVYLYKRVVYTSEVWHALSIFGTQSTSIESIGKLEQLFVWCELKIILVFGGFARNIDGIDSSHVPLDSISNKQNWEYIKDNYFGNLIFS
jgi:hypothetical protein